MDLKKYQELALRTLNPEVNSYKDKLINGTLGLAGESGEFAELVKKHLFHGHELDKEKARSELGDIMWYFSLLCHALGIDPESVLEKNILKLKARYPNKFTTTLSLTRKDGG